MLNTLNTEDSYRGTVAWISNVQVGDNVRLLLQRN